MPRKKKDGPKSTKRMGKGVAAIMRHGWVDWDADRKQPIPPSWSPWSQFSDITRRRFSENCGRRTRNGFFCGDVCRRASISPLNASGAGGTSNHTE